MQENHKVVFMPQSVLSFPARHKAWWNNSEPLVVSWIVILSFIHRRGSVSVSCQSACSGWTDVKNTSKAKRMYYPNMYVCTTIPPYSTSQGCCREGRIKRSTDPMATMHLINIYISPCTSLFILFISGNGERWLQF